MGDLLAIILTVAAFLGGMLLKGSIDKKKRIKQEVEQASVNEREGAHAAKQRFDQRVKTAKEKAAAEINRTAAGDTDPVAALVERIRRHRTRGHNGNG